MDGQINHLTDLFVSIIIPDPIATFFNLTRRLSQELSRALQIVVHFGAFGYDGC
jgi:hypothetical protein